MIGEILDSLFAFTIYPGFLFAAELGLIFMWLNRKIVARFQGRQGPPFLQPFYDFVKLLGKDTLVPAGMSKTLYFGLPFAALFSLCFVLALFPLSGNMAVSFSGDLILILYLLEMPAFCEILAGFSSRSIYAQVGASREAALMLGYSIPFISAVVGLGIQVGSFRISDVIAAPFGIVHVFAIIALLLALPARLKTNPFSIPNAEQEIVAGTQVEYNGPALAIFELVHGLEITAQALFIGVLFIPAGLSWPIHLLLILVSAIVVVILVSSLSAATARYQIQQAFRFYWLWGFLAAALVLCCALIF